MERSKKIQVVESLLEAARKAHDSGDALRYSQAACNAANAICALSSALADSPEEAE